MPDQNVISREAPSGDGARVQETRGHLEASFMFALRSSIVCASLGLACIVGSHAAAGQATSPAGQVVQGNTQFALDLYAQLRGEEGNIFLSPHSISTALAMTWAGARGETADQMADTLHFTLPQAQLHPAFGALEETILGAGDDPAGPEIHIANRLWGEQSMTFREPFLAVARDHYDGGFEALDFVGATEQARQTINDWVEDQTADRITELLQPPDLDSSVVMVLTNAIYFKGTWLTRFDERYSRDGEFFVSTSDPVTVPFMGVTEDLPYFANDDLHAIELPYEGERMSMVLLVPRERDGLPALEESLTATNLEGWLDGLSEKTVFVSMPRFKLEDRFHLEETLPAMGMPLAFTAGQADFSGICGSPGSIWIDLVIHQTFIEVNEEGTEAAGATAVVMKRGGGPPIIRADHPFLFLIRDRATGAILFLGRVSDPS
jgi:serpin B